LLGIWIKNVLNEAALDERESGVYVILPVILFIISILIAVAATVIIIVVYFEQNIVENHRLREARRIAEQSNTAKSEFLAHMSHEIRTPINAVIGMNEMIRHKSMKAYGALPSDRESIKQVFADITDYSANIDSAGNSLLSIINDILDLSKIEAGKLEIREARYELSSILNDVSNMVGFRAQAKGLEYVVDVEEALPDCLYGDEVRLRQIVTNVLNNAVKYTPEGRVTLSVTGEKPYQNEAGKTLDLMFTVRDTGIGMRQEDLGKLYQRFERMDMAEKSSIEGTGLGLAITHQLLDMMNGRIEVRSKLNKGSEFIISIPQRIEAVDPIGNFREKYERSREPADPCEETFYAPSAHILIVDDIRMNLMVATGLLMDTGIKMDLAGSGAEALRLFSETQYDMVFLDQRMPEMDGIETLHRLRKKEGEGKNTPVVCLTADAIEGAKKRYMEEGFTDYITKPIDGCALKKMVLKYLPQEKIENKGENNEKEKSSEKESILNETKEALNMEMTDKRETGNGAETGGFFETLIKAGVDPEKGMENSQNDEDFYQILLNEYLKSAPDRMEKLKKYFEERDKKNYAIQAHSLKSTSRTIGAVSLGDTAEWLEKASDGEDWDNIEKKHLEMLETYDMTVKTIKSAMPR
nr:response regulator [Lachnospiraceae bacterium]